MSLTKTNPAELEPINRMFTRRSFMVYDVLVAQGRGITQAEKMVNEWAKKHPDVDLDEPMTWHAWNEQD